VGHDPPDLTRVLREGYDARATRVLSVIALGVVITASLAAAGQGIISGWAIAVGSGATALIATIVLASHLLMRRRAIIIDPARRVVVLEWFPYPRFGLDLWPRRRVEIPFGEIRKIVTTLDHYLRPTTRVVTARSRFYIHEAYQGRDELVAYLHAIASGAPVWHGIRRPRFALGLIAALALITGALWVIARIL